MTAIDTSSWTDQEANETVQAIIKRSLTDMDFRQLVLADPTAAVKQQTGKDLPAGFTVRAVDNAGANLTLVLPDPIASSPEFSDSDLEQVAGGAKCGATCGATEACAVSGGGDGVWCLATCGGSALGV